MASKDHFFVVEYCSTSIHIAQSLPAIAVFFSFLLSRVSLIAQLDNAEMPTSTRDPIEHHFPEGLMLSLSQQEVHQLCNALEQMQKVTYSGEHSYMRLTPVTFARERLAKTSPLSRPRFTVSWGRRVRKTYT